jgi:hypothetical protein
VLAECILENTKETTKGNMASGIVALGLMPTILVFLGSSTAETVLLARRRPLLAFLIACGSPSVNPLRTFTYADPVADLKTVEGHLVPTSFRPRQAALVTLLEFIFVLAAVANTYTACYQMGFWTVNTMSCDSTFYPLAWAALTLWIHLCGMLALSLRVKTAKDQIKSSKPGYTSKLTQWFKHEAEPCIMHEKLVLAWKPQTYVFVGMSWLISVSTVAHIVYGTVTFSGLYFIGKISTIPQADDTEKCVMCLGWLDSLTLIGRLFASTIVCRAVLMFELAGMRHATEGKRRRDGGDS